MVYQAPHVIANPQGQRFCQTKCPNHNLVRKFPRHFIWWKGRAFRRRYFYKLFRAVLNHVVGCYINVKEHQLDFKKMKMFLTNAWHRPVLITSRWWMSCWTWRRPETSQTSLWTNFQRGVSPWRTSSWRRPLGEERLDKLAQFRDLSEKMIREPWLLQSHQLQSCLLPISAKRKILC